MLLGIDYSISHCTFAKKYESILWQNVVKIIVNIPVFDNSITTQRFISFQFNCKFIYKSKNFKLLT